jgi:hypothetical protein
MNYYQHSPQLSSLGNEFRNLTRRRMGDLDPWNNQDLLKTIQLSGNFQYPRQYEIQTGTVYVIS